MAERRAISSSIWDDEWFGSLDFIAMALWVGLFSRQADDQGRMLDNAALIGRKVFTYKDIPASDIEPLLEQFAQGGKIIRYEAGGKRYIQIVNWWEHQPMQYAVPSNFPPPPGWVDRYNTTYKGHKIVFNWQARETTPDGERLWGILNNLPKMSTWTSYLGTLNPNPNPNPNLNTKDSGGKQKQAAGQEKREEPTPQPPAKTPPPQKQPKKQAQPRTPDPRAKHPAVLLVKGVCGKPPPKTVWDTLISRMGDHPDGEKFAKVNAAWDGRGLNPQNISGKLDWYENGIPPAGGGNRKPNAATSTAAELGWRPA